MKWRGNNCWATCLPILWFPAPCFLFESEYIYFKFLSHTPLPATLCIMHGLPPIFLTEPYVRKPLSWVRGRRGRGSNKARSMTLVLRNFRLHLFCLLAHPNLAPFMSNIMFSIFLAELRFQNQKRHALKHCCDYRQGLRPGARGKGRNAFFDTARHDMNSIKGRAAGTTSHKTEQNKTAQHIEQALWCSP